MAQYGKDKLQEVFGNKTINLVKIFTDKDVEDMRSLMAKVSQAKSDGNPNKGKGLLARIINSVFAALYHTLTSL